MITKITDTIYKNEIILPNNPLRMLNSYIITSEGDTLVVDTGFNLPECKRDFLSGLDELGIRLEDIDLLGTHVHSDHSGLMSVFCDRVKSVSMGAVDAAILESFTNTTTGWESHGATVKMFGLDHDNINLNDNPGYALMSNNHMVINKLFEGDVIKVGIHSFEVINTPGHTPGHICLYDMKNKIMITGDHVLGRITPNIAFWGFSRKDILGIYLESLFKIRNYDVKYILSGHREAPFSLSERVDDLIAHHSARLNEVEKILSQGEKTVREVASVMKWSVNIRSWDDFPKTQKLFAAHEAMSHLEHLVYTGSAQRKNVSETLYYSLCV